MTSKHEDIEVSYSVSNEFFALWLDEAMHYTSASYLSGDETLEQAQVQKANILWDYAEMSPEKLVLDIGCGWGSTLEYWIRAKGLAKAHGITLSTAQRDWVNARKVPGLDVRLQDFHTYEPEQKYDGIVSIEMIDHICSPKQAREGKAVELYRGYFKRVHSWMKPGTAFACQAILRDRIPRGKADLEDLAFTADVIFPGGLNPRLEEIVMAVRPYFEIEELRTQRTSYGKTTAEWLRRLRLNEATIRAQWGDQVFEDYDRYLRTCVKAFDNHWSSDVQLKLRHCPV